MADTPTRTIPRKPVETSKPKPASLKALVDKFRQFATLKQQVEAQEERLGALKADLSTSVETLGYQDDKGHFFLDLPEEVEVGGKVFRTLKRERRATVGFDAARAEALLADKGLLAECQTTIVVLDEQKIKEAFYEKKISKRDLDKMFPTKVSYAFKPVS
jgi:hypothetical protein